MIFKKTMKAYAPLSLALAVALATSGCGKTPSQVTESSNDSAQQEAARLLVDPSRLNIYHPVELKSDLSHLSDNQKTMVSLLIDAAEIMDDLFWKQAFFGDKATFLNSFNNENIRHFAAINYGPWDRLNGDAPFLSGYDAKSHGAEFYPHTVDKATLASANISDKTSLYTLIKENEAGKLVSVPYSVAYKQSLSRAADILRKAATFADNQAFAEYLTLRAEALVTDEYFESDMAWMDMKTNPIELVLGPIETYEDQLFGYKAAFEAYVLIKDLAWSEKLAKYAAFLPELQQGLPVAEEYKAQ
ncbi:MAG TPA: Zn-dependent hydrolase, partial [Alteromonas australica]|nr:Zn-dependent hydrolase [Alteromonas australica]